MVRAILMAAVGGPEVLQPAEVAELEFGRRDVRVELRAAGVNPVDAKLRGHGTIAGAPPAILGRGGAGGVGHLSVQIARTAGARVAATVSAGPKAELAAKLGAERCIDYRGEDVGEAVRAWAGGDGADVVHDTVGGRTFAGSFGLVRPYGDL